MHLTDLIFSTEQHEDLAVVRNNPCLQEDNLRGESRREPPTALMLQLRQLRRKGLH